MKGNKDLKEIKAGVSEVRDWLRGFSRGMAKSRPAGPVRAPRSGLAGAMSPRKGGRGK